MMNDFAPFIPSDDALNRSDIADKAMALTAASAKLSGQLHPKSLETLERYMRVINSYYSNLIEGHATRPDEVRAAQRGEYSDDPAKRDLQLESLAHISTQGWIRESDPDIDGVFSVEFISEVHRRFYQEIPEQMWLIFDAKGQAVDKVVPGAWRSHGVTVGQHIAIPGEQVADAMQHFCRIYDPSRYRGDRRLIAIAAAHHRFAWIHPFADGNGRVVRLLTDAALRAVGLDSYGAWCLSRGLARSSASYKTRLHNADQTRQGSYDGRGPLTEKGLITFCDYMLDTANDQVRYISDLLSVHALRERIDGYVQARNDGRVRGVEKLKPVAATLLYTAFIQGEISRAQAIELTGMSERSASRLLSELKKDGLLSDSSNKSPLRWEIPEHAEPWYFPELAPGMIG